LNVFQRSVRFGLWAILCTFVVRLAPTGQLNWLKESKTAAFFASQETGQAVRFSVSSPGFFPDFMESPPPVIPEEEIPPLPVFSDPEGIQLYYGCHVDIDTRQLLTQPLTWDLFSAEPTVLILHTHSTESYTKSGESYRETAQWRTLDANYNMLSIGSYLAQLLETAGIRVIRDETIHDYPSYNGSYVHARQSIQKYLDAYPSIRLILDLHRDASGGSAGQLRTAAEIAGETAAQLMVVIGTNHPDFRENASLGLKLHAQLEAEAPGITRPLQLRSQRFNQDLSPGALLIEVGAAGNTHAEALRAAQVLARAVTALARGTRQG